MKVFVIFLLNTLMTVKINLFSINMNIKIKFNIFSDNKLKFHLEHRTVLFSINVTCSVIICCYLFCSNELFC